MQTHPGSRGPFPKISRVKLTTASSLKLASPPPPPKKKKTKKKKQKKRNKNKNKPLALRVAKRLRHFPLPKLMTVGLNAILDLVKP